MNALSVAAMFSVWAWLKSPPAIALASMAIGFGLLLAGVFVLLGLGATLLVAALPPLAFGYALAKGLTRGE